MKQNVKKNLLRAVVLVFWGAFSYLNLSAQMNMDMPTLDPTTIPKFVNQLTIPDIWVPTFVVRDPNTGQIVLERYDIHVAPFFTQMLPPGFPPTQAYGYGGLVRPANSSPSTQGVFKREVPGPTYMMTRNRPAILGYHNDIVTPNFMPVDPTIHWANPNMMDMPCPPFIPFPPGYPQAQFPVPHDTHTHGIEARAGFDGVPETWFTYDGKVGDEFVGTDYYIPNSNEPTTFWYHDHTMGITRLQVYAGLSGFHILNDPNNPLDNPIGGQPAILPTGKYDIPLLINDKSFNSDGSLFYPRIGDLPDLHPYWRLMFDGQVNLVNGKVWPNLNVERHQYRFRILDNSNQRFYNLFFSNNMSFTIIGTDGGFKEVPSVVNSFFIGVTERVTILVDFSQFAPGTKIVLMNNGQISPPLGPLPDPNTDGTVMQFTVIDSPVVTPPPLPARLNSIATLTADAPRRILIQNADTDEAGNIIQAQLDGQLFTSATTEQPQVGSTEDWYFVNTTPLDHNKHVHLIQYQLIERLGFDATRYLNDWMAANGGFPGGPPPFDHPTVKLPIEPYLTGERFTGKPEEIGWKDTIHVPAGQITHIRIRWAPQRLPTGSTTPGVNEFPFDPTGNPGYIWHCHLLEHEDNEMMRDMIVVNERNYPDWDPTGVVYNFGDKVRLGRFAYMAIQTHTSSLVSRPDIAPTVWAVFTNYPSSSIEGMMSPCPMSTRSTTPTPTITIAPTPTPTVSITPTPSPTTALSVRYECGDPEQPTNNTLMPRFIIVNDSNTPVQLSELILRYYYTIDGDTQEQYTVDYANVGANNVIGSFGHVMPPVSNADHYLEIGFTSAAGSIAPHSNSGEIHIRLNKVGWANYNEAGDYSYDGTRSTFNIWNKVTLYRGRALVFGIEP